MEEDTGIQNLGERLGLETTWEASAEPGCVFPLYLSANHFKSLLSPVYVLRPRLGSENTRLDLVLSLPWGSLEFGGNQS